MNKDAIIMHTIVDELRKRSKFVFVLNDRDWDGDKYSIYADTKTMVNMHPALPRDIIYIVDDSVIFAITRFICDTRCDGTLKVPVATRQLFAFPLADPQLIDKLTNKILGECR